MIASTKGVAAVAQLLVRKIPDEVMAGLRNAAQADGISVEEFARRVLRDQSERRNRWHEFVGWSKRFTTKQRPKRTTGTATTRLIREDRGR